VHLSGYSTPRIWRTSRTIAIQWNTIVKSENNFIPNIVEQHSKVSGELSADDGDMVWHCCDLWSKGPRDSQSLWQRHKHQAGAQFAETYLIHRKFEREYVIWRLSHFFYQLWTRNYDMPTFNFGDLEYSFVLKTENADQHLTRQSPLYAKTNDPKQTFS
jgi:hypothetical protein